MLLTGRLGRMTFGASAPAQCAAAPAMHLTLAMSMQRPLVLCHA